MNYDVILIFRTDNVEYMDTKDLKHPKGLGLIILVNPAPPQSHNE